MHSPSMSMLRFVLLTAGNRFRKKEHRSYDTKYTPSDLEILATLMEEGKVKSVIEKSNALDQVVAAHTHYETGRTAGKLVVNVRSEEPSDHN